MCITTHTALPPVRYIGHNRNLGHSAGRTLRARQKSQHCVSRGLVLVPKGWCCVRAELLLSLSPDCAGSLQHVPRPLSHLTCSFWPSLGLLPRLLFTPSEPTPALPQHLAGRRGDHSWSCLNSFPGSLLRITASSHWPHKTPTKTFVAALVSQHHHNPAQPPQLSARCGGCAGAGCQPHLSMPAS